MAEWLSGWGENFRHCALNLIYNNDQQCAFLPPQGNPSQDLPKPRVPHSAWPGSLIQSLLVHMFLLTCLLARARWLRRAFASSVSETDATLRVFSMCFQYIPECVFLVATLLGLPGWRMFEPSEMGKGVRDFAPAIFLSLVALD